MNYYLKQYELVKGARGALLNYCETIQEADLSKPVESFGNSAIRNMLVHNANVYLHWILKFAQNEEASYYKPEDYANIEQIKELYENVNRLVESYFGKQTDTTEITTVSGNVRNSVMKVNLLTLFTHVITHEFHHKGQILTMSRLLGYTPVDMDIIRF